MAGAIGRSGRKEAMRYLVFFFFALFGLFGCAKVFALDDYTTLTDSPGTPGSTSGGGATGGEAGSPANLASITAQNHGARACRVNADCVTEPGAVCVKATGACEVLTTTECPRVYGDATNDGAVFVGTILHTAGGDEQSLERAAVLAAEELDAPAPGGGLPPATPGGAARPLVVVSCDEGADVLPAARHLVEDLRVSAIVGPTTGEHVVDVTQQVSAKNGTLVMAPTSLVSSLALLADDGLTWRDVPSDAQRAKLVIQQITDLETVIRSTRRVTSVKLGVVFRGDAAGTSTRDSIAGKLIINGHFIGDPENAGNVSIDGYDRAEDTAAMAAIASKYATSFVPDVVFVTGAEQIASVIVPLEQTLTAARALYHPYYVCAEAAKTQAFLDAVGSSSLPPDLKRRVRGVGTRPDTTSAPVLAAYAAAYAHRWPDDLGAASSAPAYDAMYAVAGAVVAGGGATPTGASVARGLRALGVGDSFSVGPTNAAQIAQALAAGRSVSLRGTSSLMQWDANGDIAGGTVEVWCIGAGGFGSSGLAMDLQTQVVGGAFVQCQ